MTNVVTSLAVTLRAISDINNTFGAISVVGDAFSPTPDYTGKRGSQPPRIVMNYANRVHTIITTDDGFRLSKGNTLTPSIEEMLNDLTGNSVEMTDDGTAFLIRGADRSWTCRVSGLDNEYVFEEVSR